MTESRKDLDPKLLEILVCPVTKGPLDYDRTAQELVSRKAGLAYPIREGIPIMLAQPIPNPVMAKNSNDLSCICGKNRNPMAATVRHNACVILGLYFLANPTKAKATRKVTILYQPLTKPVQLTACS